MASEDSAESVRLQLMQGLPRWRRDLTLDLGRGTLGMGIGQRSVALCSTLIRLAVLGLLPEAELPVRPTLGKYVHEIERFGPKRRAECLGLSGRRLVTRREVDLLNRFARHRAVLAHQEEGPVIAERIGRLDPSDVAELLTVVEQVAWLPIIEELICREKLGQASKIGAHPQ